MSYEKTNWLKRIVEFPDRFELETLDEQAGLYRITPRPGTIEQEGTPLTEENLNNLENQVEKLSQEPLYLKSAAYDSGNDQIDCTFAAGQVELFNGDSRVLVQVNDDAIYSINSPATNTAYYLFLKSDGNFTHNTDGTVPDGAVFIWEVATGDPVDNITKTDRRYQISGVGAKLNAHLAETAPHQQQELIYLTDPNTGKTYRFGIDGSQNRMYYEEVV